MLTEVVLRIRYRALGDTAAVQVELPSGSPVATVRDDHDVDQVLEWVQLDGETFALSAAQILHVSALVACDALRLPPGAAVALRRVLSISDTRVSEASEIEVRCSVDALSMPSAPHPAPAVAEPVASEPAATDASRELAAALATSPGHIASGAQAALWLARRSSSTST